MTTEETPFEHIVLPYAPFIGKECQHNVKQIDSKTVQITGVQGWRPFLIDLVKLCLPRNGTYVHSIPPNELSKYRVDIYDEENAEISFTEKRGFLEGQRVQTDSVTLRGKKGEIPVPIHLVSSGAPYHEFLDILGMNSEEKREAYRNLEQHLLELSGIITPGMNEQRNIVDFYLFSMLGGFCLSAGASNPLEMMTCLGAAGITGFLYFREQSLLRRQEDLHQHLHAALTTLIYQSNALLR